MFHDRELIDIIWICSKIIAVSLVMGTGVILSRAGSPYRWLILAGAALFGVTGPHSTVVLALRLLDWIVGEPQLRLWQKVDGIANIAGLILFLLGILLQCLRQKGEVARIAELEAILQDQQRPVPPSDRR